MPSLTSLPMFIEELVAMANIGFRLLHGRHVKKHKRLRQMMIGAEGSDRLAGSSGSSISVIACRRHRMFVPMRSLEI